MILVKGYERQYIMTGIGYDSHYYLYFHFIFYKQDKTEKMYLLDLRTPAPSSITTYDVTYQDNHQVYVWQTKENVYKQDRAISNLVLVR